MSQLSLFAATGHINKETNESWIVFNFVLSATRIHIIGRTALLETSAASHAAAIASAAESGLSAEETCSSSSNSSVSADHSGSTSVCSDSSSSFVSSASSNSSAPDWNAPYKSKRTKEDESSVAAGQRDEEPPSQPQQPSCVVSTSHYSYGSDQQQQNLLQQLKQLPPKLIPTFEAPVAAAGTSVPLTAEESARLAAEAEIVKMKQQIVAAVVQSIDAPISDPMDTLTGGMSLLLSRRDLCVVVLVYFYS